MIVKLTPLLATPETVTTTLPVVAPEGTGATMLAAPQLVGVYMHMNPVKRGLALRSGDWIWSSAEFYAGRELNTIRIDPVA